MLHKLTTWEDNGYHDSYFYESVWDDKKREVRAIETGATAYAGGRGEDPAITDPAVLADAIRWLAGHIYGVIRDAEYRDVLEPQDAPKGARLRTLRDVKPRKGAMIPAGTEGEVVWCGAYGTFYAKGYNHPCRGNRRVGLLLNDGSTVFVALSACRLACEPLSDEDLASRAWDLAQHCGFSVATGVKHAWDSRNYALELLERTRTESPAMELAEVA